MDRPVVVSSSGLSAGAVAAIAVCTTLVGAFFIACLCLLLSRRRQRNATLQHEVSQIPNFDWEEIETNTTDARQPKKLQKQRKDWTQEAIANTRPHDSDSGAESSEGGEALMREVSPIRPTPLPQLPPFKRSLFTSVFRSGSSPVRSTKSSRTNKTGSPERPEKAYRQRDWIDEDVLHGPKVKMQLQTDQTVARDSWPLYSKLASPTLPIVLSNDVQQQQHNVPYQFHGVGSQYQPCYQPHFPTTLQYSVPAPEPHPHPQMQQPQPQHQYNFHPSQQYNGQGQRYLPLPPRPVLITGNSVSQAMGNQFYDMQQLLEQSKAFAQHAQAQQAASAAAAAAAASSGPARKTSSTLSGKRKASTDSTLSEILKSTEERLMQGSPTRSRPTTSGTGVSETIKRVRYSNENEDEQPRRRSASPVKLLPVAYSGPQPKKFTFSASFERRGSDGSVDSDASDDSTFGLPVVPPENELPTQLSSPHRTPTKTHDKSPSGSLSTIADEGEEEAETLKLEEMEARYLNQIAALSAKTPSPVNPRALKAKSMPGPENNDPFVSPSSSPTKKTPQSARTNRETIRRVRSLRMSTFGEPTPPPSLPAPPTPNTGKHLSVNLEQQLPNQAALGVLPLDLYALRTPVRQTAVKSPTIVPADPSNPNSVHAKKFSQSTSRPSLSAPESPSSVVKMEIAKATVPGLRLSKQAGNDGKKPVQANTSSPRISPDHKTKAVPPSHELRPKGSSPTLGSYSGMMKSIRGPAPPISLVTPKTHRRSVSIKLSGAGSGRRRSMSGVSRQSSTLSQASSIYSQDSVGELPQITVNRASTSTPLQSPQNHVDASPPVVATVAALRRMNSVVSTGSGPSESGSPTTKTAEFVSVARRHRKGRGSKGSRNYLGLLEMKGLNLPTVEGREKASPKKMKENVSRGSMDSLGLYDDDGFLISSPVRGAKSP
jgi:hypothetical protein